MTAWARMAWFHLRMFLRNNYFVQLLFTSTLTMLALQLLAARATHTDASASAWLRAGLVGTWSVTTVAAGLIGFQRFQGTLVHLVFTPMRPGSVLAPLVGSASTFGLAAFPVAALASWMLGHRPEVDSWPLLALGVVAYWLACLALALTVAALFVVTENAITYEGLLLVPLILLSGVFGYPEALPTWAQAAAHVLPTTPAVTLVLEPGRDTVTNMVASLAVSAVWFAVASVMTSAAMRKATRDASLEMI